MAERGASPNVPPTRRRLLRAAGVFFTPLLPDDYLELINPLWTTREVRGRIEAIEPETAARQLRMERFQPVIDGNRAGGAGGPIVFTKRRACAVSDGTVPILVAGEHAGLDLPYGCRMGICRTCVGRLCAGRVRDLRTGKVSGQPGGDRPHLHQRPRGSDRDRSLKRRNPCVDDDRKPAGATDRRGDRRARQRHRAQRQPRIPAYFRRRR